MRGRVGHRCLPTCMRRLTRWVPSGLLRACALAVIPWLGVSDLAGQEEIYEQGNQLYQAGDHAAALEAYQAVRAAGFESSDLYYNLGNAYFKTGDLGRSILHYERALRLASRDPDVLANLELARSLTADEVEPLPRFWLLSAFWWWVDLLPRSALIAVVSTAYLLAMGGLCVRILSRGLTVGRVGAWLAAGGGVVVLLVGTNLLIRELGAGEPVRGIILVEEVAVQSAPAADDDLTLFQVHEGTRVRVDQRTETWSEVVLDDGKVGWVPTEVMEII